jgi:DNA polymerase-4
VTGLHRIDGPPVEIAARLRARVRDQVGLPITVGIARTKFLAKVASGVAKPDGLLLVPPDAELAFLHPLPVERLWGVGPVTAAKLHARGIRTVGKVAGLGEAALISVLGQAAGRHLHALAHNLDPRPVQVGRRRGSIGSQHALGRGHRTPEDLDAILAGLVDRVARRMRAAQRIGRTVTLRLRFDDFTRATRSHTLPRASCHTQTILEAGRRLLAAALPIIQRQGVTLVGIAVGNLEDGNAVQLALPFDRGAGEELDAALDAVRERFGSASVGRAALLGRDQGLVVPMLPD